MQELYGRFVLIWALLLISSKVSYGQSANTEQNKGKTSLIMSYNEITMRITQRHYRHYNIHSVFVRIVIENGTMILTVISLNMLCKQIYYKLISRILFRIYNQYCFT